MRNRLGLILALAALGAVLTACAPYPADLVAYPVEHKAFAETDDGWRLAVYHFPPTGSARAADPIIMCHGFTSTSVTFYQGDDRGLAPYLARLGYDVWAVNLRGRPPGTYPGDGSTKRYGWTVDDYIRRDVPALLNLVTARTGKQRVTWVGHSMGGMIVYAYLGVTSDPRIARFIAVSSPIRFADMSDRLYNLARRGRKWFKNDDVIHLPGMVRWAGPFRNSSLAVGYIQLVVNRDNVTDDQWRRYLANGLTNVSGAEALQLADWTLREVMTSQDGQTNYRREMKNLRVPILAITGKLDNLAPPSAVQPMLDWVGSEDKTFHVFGLANGYRADYGHLDIMIGRHVNEDVFPFLAAWLEARP